MSVNNLDSDSIKRRIWAIDLEPIIFKMMHGEDAKGWSLEHTLAAVEEYRRFLFLAATRQGALVPSRTVDAVWHAHILDTAKYREDCERTFGFFLDHFPYFGMRGEEDLANLKRTFQEGRDAYESVFGPCADAGQDAANCGDCCHVNCSPIDDVYTDVVRAHDRPKLAA